MCSIIGGYVGPQTDQQEIKTLFTLSQERGHDAFGLFFAPEDLEDPYQVADSGYNDPPNEIEWDELGAFSQGILLGCLRGEPTTEWNGETADKDIQPFTVGQWTVVHNGTIANDKDLIREMEATSSQVSPTHVDTWVIAMVFDRFGFEVGLRKLKGSFAILAYRSEEPSKVYYACNYKPLWVLGDAGSQTVLFASQRKYLEPVSSDDFLSTVQPHQIEPYTYGSINGGYHQRLGTLYPVRTGRKKTLVVCSGGLDSGVVAWYHAIRKGDDVTLLHLRYNAKAEPNEVRAIQNLQYRIAAELNVPLDDVPVAMLETNFFSLHATSSLTDDTREVAKGVAGAEYAHEWVPARNTVMMALAFAYAEAHGYDCIALGSNQEESCGGYPDNEQEFINKLRDLAPYAVKPYHQLEISDPLGGMMKHEIVTFGSQLPGFMPFDFTWSCYKANTEGIHCGDCGPCVMRQRAFKMAGVEDPTKYAIESA